MRNSNILQFRRRNDSHFSSVLAQAYRDAAHGAKFLTLMNLSVLKICGLQMVLFSEVASRNVETLFSVFEIAPTTNARR